MDKIPGFEELEAAKVQGLAEQHAGSSLEKLVAQALQISYGDAKRRVRAAAACGPWRTMSGQEMEPLRPLLAAAQAAGETGPSVVEVIERTLAKVELLDAGQVAQTEEVLIRYGKTLDHVELGRVCDRIMEYLDPDGSRPRDAVQADRRELFLSRCRDGMVKVDGRLTPAAGARIKAVLGPLAAPRSSTEVGVDGAERLLPDVRSSQQRLHDALDEACVRLLRAGSVPTSGGTPATVIISIREDQLPSPMTPSPMTPSPMTPSPMTPSPKTPSPKTPGPVTPSRTAAGTRADTRTDTQADTQTDTLSAVAREGGQRFDASGSGASNPERRPGSSSEGSAGFGFEASVRPTVETTTGEVLSVAEAMRIASEAEIISVVLSGTGRPLHLGRTRRLASKSQTYALIARDGGCSFPGCTVTPEWCERHHVVPWALGGVTDVDNLTLLCGYHHSHFVQAGWAARINADGLPEWLPPGWQDRHRRPLINHRILDRHRPLDRHRVRC